MELRGDRGGAGSPMWDVVVVGAGAAGCMAALFAAGEGRRVLLLERSRDGGRKILISGGGRCNILPSSLSPTQYVTSSSPNTMKKILLSWPLPEQQRFFPDVLGVRLQLEPETGKLFPESNRARDVRDRLLEAVRDRGGQIRFEAVVTEVQPATRGWVVELEGGEAIRTHTIVLATGGLSVPATGSDGIGLRIVRRLGHTIHETYPSLTPLTASPAVHAHLAGISLDVTLEAPLPKGSFRTHGGFLFTHRGYSGPAVLNVSHLAVRGRFRGERQPILVQWTTLEASAVDQALRSEKGTVGGFFRKHLPDRLADTLVVEAEVAGERQLAQLRREERERLVTALARYPLPWTSDEGYKKAEVTGGGVALGEVDTRTLESKLRPGLFLCGEILDAFGPIGGYNFCWAWATGRTAGLAAARSESLQR